LKETSNELLARLTKFAGKLASVSTASQSYPTELPEQVFVPALNQLYLLQYDLRMDTSKSKEVQEILLCD
jgi:hypothetical protein